MPKPYVRKMPATWWLRKSAYFYFMLRELTAVFVAGYCVFLLIWVYKLRESQAPPGREAYDIFLDAQQSVTAIVLHSLALLAAIYHSITWFNLTPKVMVVRMGEEKLSPSLIIASNYLAWLAVSGLLIWLVVA